MNLGQLGPSPVGVSGWIGPPGVNPLDTTTPGFQGTFYAYEIRAAGQSRQRYGPDTNGNVQYRLTKKGHTIILSGIEVPFNVAEPSSWRGQVKTVVVQYGINETILAASKTAGKTDADAILDAVYSETFSVMVESFDKSRDELGKTPGYVKIDITCRCSSDPTYSAAWGTLQSGGDITKQDQRQYEGTSLTLDLNGLASSGQITVDLYGSPIGPLSDLQSRLQQLMATVAIPSGYKRRPGTITQDSPDGGTFVIPVGLTDTADDILNPRNTANIDPNHLGSTATAAQFNSAPSTPSGDVFVLRSTSQEKLNDGKTLHTSTFGLRSTAEDITRPGSRNNTDPYDLTSTGVQTQVYDPSGSVPNPTVPSGLQTVSTTFTTDNANRSIVIREFAKDSSKQKAEQAESYTFTDPSNLTSRQRVSAYDGTPSLSAGFVSRGTTVKNLTHDHTLTTTDGGLRSTKADEEMPGTEINTDPNSLTSSAVQTIVYADGNEPDDATIALPTDTEIIDSIVQQLNNGEYKKVFRYGIRNAKHEIEWLQSRRQIDTGNLDVFCVVVEVTSSATPDPSGDNPDSTNLSYHHSESHRISATQYVHLHEFRTFTPTEAVEEEGNLTVDDPISFMVGDNHARQVTSSSTPPSTPVIASRVCVRRTTRRIGKVKYQHDWFYDLRSNADRLEAEKTRTIVDLSGLESEAVTADVYTGSAPSDPTLSDFVLISHADLTTQSPDYTLRVYQWGLLTNAQKITMPRTFIKTDATNLASEAQQSQVYTTLSGAPATTITPPTDTEVVETIIQELNQTKSEQLTKWGMRNPQHEIEWLRSPRQVETGNLDIFAVVAKVTSSATPDASGLNPDTTNLSLHHSETRKFTATQYVHVHEFRPLTAIEAIEAEGQITVSDPVASLVGDDHYRQVTTSSTPPSTPVIASRFCVKLTTRRVGKALWQHDWFYDLQSNATKIEFAETVGRADPLEGYKHRTASVVAWTDTAEALAESVNTSQTSPTYNGVEGRRLSPTKALQVIETTQEDKKVHSVNSTVELVSLRGVPSGGFGNPDATVRFKAPGQFVGGPGGFTSGEVQPTFRYRALGSFALRRRFYTSDPSGMFFPDLIGKVCSGSFLGRADHSVMYAGPADVFTYSISGRHLAIVDFLFKTDSLLFFNDGDLPIGRVFVYGDGLIQGTGNVIATTFDPFAFIRWPGEANFSVFMA